MNITKHAFERMNERGMTPEMLATLMDGKIAVVPTRDEKFLVVGLADGKMWTVVMASDMYTVVTVRRSHKEEVDLWTSK